MWVHNDRLDFSSARVQPVANFNNIPSHDGVDKLKTLESEIKGSDFDPRTEDLPLPVDPITL